MEKILFFLVLLGLIFFYYAKPFSLEEPAPAPKQEEVKKEKPKSVLPKKEVQEQKQIIEVSPATEEKPLPQLSDIITTNATHPYADPDKYPLHYAICKEDLTLIRQVLKKENLINEQGEVVRGTKECYCPENKYEICACEAILTMPPLNLAVWKKNEDIIKYLLRRKANPLLKDELGRNALDIAQQQNMAEVQDLLAKYIK